MRARSCCKFNWVKFISQSAEANLVNKRLTKMVFISAALREDVQVDTMFSPKFTTVLLRKLVIYKYISNNFPNTAINFYDRGETSSRNIMTRFFMYCGVVGVASITKSRTVQGDAAPPPTDKNAIDQIRKILFHLTWTLRASGGNNKKVNDSITFILFWRRDSQ